MHSRWLSSAVRVLENGASLKTLLQGAGKEKLVVVDWTAAWCGPCKMISPVLDRLSEANPEVLFVKVDVDQHSQQAAEAGIQAMPTFQFVKDSKVVSEFAGADTERLKQFVEKFK